MSNNYKAYDINSEGRRLILVSRSVDLQKYYVKFENCVMDYMDFK